MGCSIDSELAMVSKCNLVKVNHPQGSSVIVTIWAWRRIEQESWLTRPLIECDMRTLDGWGYVWVGPAEELEFTNTDSSDDPEEMSAEGIACSAVQ